MKPKILKQFCLYIVFLGIIKTAASASHDEGYYLKLIPANPDAGFNFPYILRTPTSAISDEHKYLIVESNNSGVNDSIQEHIRETQESAMGYGVGSNLARQLNTPFLVPVFPRSKSDHLVYTHALDRDTLLLTDTLGKRLDLQLLNMVEHARSRLENYQIQLNKKFVIAGFSASGTFSNRFAFLHPEKLLAVVSGGVNAFPMLPVKSVDEDNLEYPLGIADFETLSGTKFNLAAWKELPQMIFMGAEDYNDAVLFDDAYSIKERELIFEHIGENMLERWHASQAIYLQQKPNASFTTYGQIGHGTDGRINSDIVSFVRIIMVRESSKD
ncbi:MAG: hypothetical protein AB8G18_19070 [Gammaproteobacteria bacterium]